MRRRRSGRFAVMGGVAAVLVLAVAVVFTDIDPRGSGSEPARDPWFRPFRSTSIWNVPVGSEAEYKPASLPFTPRNVLSRAFLVELDATDPAVPLIRSGGWRDRCSGTEPTGYTLNLPEDLILPPPQQLPSGDWETPNNGFAFLLPDGRTIFNGGGGARCAAGGPLYGVTAGATETDLYGDGIAGSHGASHLSYLGGAIRPGELTGDRPIRHALDLLVHAEHLYSDGKRTKQSTFRWPATSSDRYALDVDDPRYIGTDPELRMGSLLALPPDLGPEDLDVTTDVGRRLFRALQDYGAYVTDDSAWDANHLVVDDAAVDAIPWDDAQRAEFGRMVAALHTITNNGPDRVGGGGVPRQPLLPEITPPS